MELNNKSQGKGRGFAAMDPEEQRKIASQGGKAAHESGHAHEFDSEEAQEAGRKGGKAAHQSGAADNSESDETRPSNEENKWPSPSVGFKKYKRVFPP